LHNNAKVDSQFVEEVGEERGTSKGQGTWHFIS